MKSAVLLSVTWHLQKRKNSVYTFLHSYTQTNIIDVQFDSMLFLFLIFVIGAKTPKEFQSLPIYDNNFGCSDETSNFISFKLSLVIIYFVQINLTFSAYILYTQSTWFLNYIFQSIFRMRRKFFIVFLSLRIVCTQKISFWHIIFACLYAGSEFTYNANSVYKKFFLFESNHKFFFFIHLLSLFIALQTNRT